LQNYEVSTPEKPGNIIGAFIQNQEIIWRGSLEILTDIKLLSEGTFFIGTCTSAIGRLAVGMMAARHPSFIARHGPVRFDAWACVRYGGEDPTAEEGWINA